LINQLTVYWDPCFATRSPLSIVFTPMRLCRQGLVSAQGLAVTSTIRLLNRCSATNSGKTFYVSLIAWCPINVPQQSSNRDTLTCIEYPALGDMHAHALSIQMHILFMISRYFRAGVDTSTYQASRHSFYPLTSRLLWCCN
jgi:hypothetical protein